MIKTSEYCTVGHPDRLCDYIVSYILDRYLGVDSTSRVALEAQLKDNHLTISGEVTSKSPFRTEELAYFAKEAVRDAGYTAEYAARWGAGNAVNADALEVVTHISSQSPDIAQGVDSYGWGDQGIFWGLAVEREDRMPLDYALAREIGQRLAGLGDERLGLDIKTLVSLDSTTGSVEQIVVAIPILPGTGGKAEGKVRDMINDLYHPTRIIINGTGNYVRHSSMGDCGTTGRKLVADFYGGNSRIGGGSPWGKDPTKADVALNILARVAAKQYMEEANEEDEVRCAISCCIGRSRISIAMFNRHDRLLSEWEENAPTYKIISKLGLVDPIYANLCRYGLFGRRF